MSGFDVTNIPFGTTATPIATRAGPGKLYETDINTLSKAIHKHNNVKTSYGQVQADPIICSLSHDTDKQLREQLRNIKTMAQGETWITPEYHERRQKSIMQALFPTPSDNPWTDLPVHPRTNERAEAEHQAFVAVPPQANDDKGTQANDRHIHAIPETEAHP